MNTPTSLFSKEEIERAIGLEYRGYAEKYNRAAASDPEAGYLAGYPQNYNGGCYQGPAALALELKMLADKLKIPVFVTAEQMEELGIGPAPGTEGVSVLHKDVIPDSVVRTKIYALEQTTFVKEYPEYFEQIKDYFQNKGYSFVGTYEEDMNKHRPLNVYDFGEGWNDTSKPMPVKVRLMKAALVGGTRFNAFKFDLQGMSPTRMFAEVCETGLVSYVNQKNTNSVIARGINIDELNSRIGKAMKSQQGQSEEQSETVSRSRSISK